MIPVPLPLPGAGQGELAEAVFSRAGVAELVDGRTQNPILATECGFDSLHRHHEPAPRRPLRRANLGNRHDDLMFPAIGPGGRPISENTLNSACVASATTRRRSTARTAFERPPRHCSTSWAKTQLSSNCSSVTLRRMKSKPPITSDSAQAEGIAMKAMKDHGLRPGDWKHPVDRLRPNEEEKILDDDVLERHARPARRKRQHALAHTDHFEVAHATPLSRTAQARLVATDFNTCDSTWRVGRWPRQSMSACRHPGAASRLLGQG